MEKNTFVLMTFRKLFNQFQEKRKTSFWAQVSLSFFQWTYKPKAQFLIEMVSIYFLS